MDALIARFADFGVLGLMCGVLIYNAFYLQKKILSVIETNTKAMTALADQCRYHTINETQYQHQVEELEKHVV
jgi:uncharacterized membrane protein YciS (DUF1049 family)